MTHNEIYIRALDKASCKGFGYSLDWIAQASIKDVIFSHEFAQAFWGGKKELHKDYICLHCGTDTAYQPPSDSGCNHVHYPEDCDVCSKKIQDWRYHLQQMVLESEPLKYLEKFL